VASRSVMRPECRPAAPGTVTWVPRDTALFLIRDAVEKRRGLIYGRLHDGKGAHCAMGAFWADNPRLSCDWELIDEVAAVNDSVPSTATPKERWEKVRSWLRWKVRVLALKSNA
jgi:hypothetical protein